MFELVPVMLLGDRIRGADGNSSHPPARDRRARRETQQGHTGRGHDVFGRALMMTCGRVR